MLSRADADVIGRDSVLPGLRTVLDPDEFAAVLGRQVPELAAAAPRIGYVRYKPGMSCLVGFHLAGSSTIPFVSAAAFHADARAKLAKAQARPGRFVRVKQSLVITLFPHDDKLTALARLEDPERRPRLLTKLMPDRPEHWAAAVELIRYKPDRRYVAKLTIDKIPRALIKLYAPSGFDAAYRNARRFSAESYHRPALIGISGRRRALVWNWMPGQPLTDLIQKIQVPLSSVGSAGAALAELHAQRSDDIPQRSRQTEAASLVPVGEWLAHIHPKIAVQTRRLAQQLTNRIEQLPPQSRPLHGDFYANQVLVDGSRVAIIDFDEAFAGDPAHDVGTFLAHLESNALRQHLAADRVLPVSEAFLNGYRDAARHRITNDRVALYTAAGLFRLAAHPFRARESHWPERTAALLARSERLLGCVAGRVTVRVDETTGLVR
jgi:tRNA A-37 threonylcarbamoyl transferase component Bud32